MDVKAARELLGWSRDELAKRVGVSSYEIAFLEARKTMTEKMHARIADVCAAASKQPNSPEDLLKRIRRDLERLPQRTSGKRSGINSAGVVFTNGGQPGMRAQGSGISKPEDDPLDG